MDFIRRITALGAFAVLALAPAMQARAAAAMVKTQAPGYYRMMLGEFEVTALLDGEFRMPASDLQGLLSGLGPGEFERALHHAFAPEPFTLSINAFLVNTGSRLVLIDTGDGAHMTADSGQLLANMKAAGYDPSRVDEIYITHMHGDHIGGLSRNGKRLFPNAVVRASRQEADYWLKPENLTSADEHSAQDYRNAGDWLEPYVKAGRFLPFDGDVVLVPGVRAVGTHGHTPGHTCYLIESRGNRLLLIGDLVHVEPIQFPDPEVTLSFDTDAKAARAERLRQFRELSENRDWVGAAHLPFPGLGHVRANGAGYDWVPATYSLVH